MKAQQPLTIDSGLAMDEAEGAIQPPARPATEAPKIEPAERQQQPSVWLSVKKDDCTILTAMIDRTASQKRIIDDLRRVLPQLAVPYRELEPGIVEATRIKSTENISFEDASICVFGSPSRSRILRYWRNRWELR
jgi:hypothetical protein